MPRLAVLSSVRWRFLWQRHHSLAAAAARDGWFVDFFEPHLRGLGHVLSVFQARAGGERAQPDVKLVDGVEIRRPPSVVGVAPQWVTRPLLRSLWENRYDAILLYLPSKEYFEWANLQFGSTVIYDRVVDWAAAPKSFWPPHEWERVEERIFQNVRNRSSWHVVCDHSKFSQDLASRGVPVKTVLPATDVEFMRMRPRRKDPIVGYFGAVREEVDVPLLAAVAKESQLEIIGMVEEPYKSVLLDAGASVKTSMGLAELAEACSRWGTILLPYRGPRASTLSPAKLFNAFALGGVVAVRGIDVPADLRGAALMLSDQDDEAVAQIKQQQAHYESAGTSVYLPTWDERWQELKSYGGLS